MLISGVFSRTSWKNCLLSLIRQTDTQTHTSRNFLKNERCTQNSEESKETRNFVQAMGTIPHGMLFCSVLNVTFDSADTRTFNKKVRKTSNAGGPGAWAGPTRPNFGSAPPPQVYLGVRTQPTSQGTSPEDVSTKASSHHPQERQAPSA